MVGWGEKTWRVGRPMTIVPPVLSDIRRQGRLTVVAPAGGEEHFGAPAPGFPEVAIRFVSRKAMRRIILDPRLGAAEAFMDGDMRIERGRSEEHTSELQSLMRISYAVFCLKKKKKKKAEDVKATKIKRNNIQKKQLTCLSTYG